MEYSAMDYIQYVKDTCRELRYSYVSDGVCGSVAKALRY